MYFTLLGKPGSDELGVRRNFEPATHWATRPEKCENEQSNLMTCEWERVSLPMLSDDDDHNDDGTKWC